MVFEEPAAGEPEPPEVQAESARAPVRPMAERHSRRRFMTFRLCARTVVARSGGMGGDDGFAEVRMAPGGYGERRAQSCRPAGLPLRGVVPR
ncbi:hypothetical protein GCM10010495_52240 [Kitasatospora herbaricolor]|nr:hypothetical protein GCM10010495_52240 [Kitasatospora herbaricolor]